MCFSGSCPPPPPNQFKIPVLQVWYPTQAEVDECYSLADLQLTIPTIAHSTTYSSRSPWYHLQLTVPPTAHGTYSSSQYHLHVQLTVPSTCVYNPYHRSGLLRWDNPPASWPAWGHWHDQSAPCQSCSDRPEIGNTASDQTILQVSTCKIAWVDMCKKSGSKNKCVMRSVRSQNAFWNPCSAQKQRLDWLTIHPPTLALVSSSWWGRDHPLNPPPKLSSHSLHLQTCPV